MVSELYRSREREKFSVMFRNTLTDKGYYDIDVAILNKSVHISFACDTIPDANCLFYHSPFEGEYPANIKDVLIRNKEDDYSAELIPAKLKRKEIAQRRSISCAYSAGRRASVEAKAKELKIDPLSNIPIGVNTA